MQALLESRYPGPFDQEYLDRLKKLPTSLVAAELDQLTASNASVASALSKVGTKHSREFAGLGAALDGISACCQAMSDAGSEARAAAAKAPPQPAQVGSLIEHLLSQDIQLYSNLAHIQELASVPALIKTCIDSEMYAAALDLGAFVNRVASRYPKSGFVQRTSAQIGQLMVEMRDHLVKQLFESSKLQAINKATSTLRKLEPFKSAPPSAIEGLLADSRLAYMQRQLDLLAPLKASGLALYLRKYIDVYRENVTMALSSLGLLATDSPAAARFVRQATRGLTGVLAAHLPDITQDRPRVLLQLTYCSYSLGRLGVEFWPFLEVLDQSEWADAYKTQQELQHSI